MCGIVGYIEANKKCSRDIIFSRLKKLEYRGHDSADISLFDKRYELFKYIRLLIM